MCFIPSCFFDYFRSNIFFNRKQRLPRSISETSFPLPLAPLHNLSCSPPVPLVFPLQVALLSCDTISQAKGKIIDAMYRTVPDSLKPTPNDVDVDWKNGSSSSLRLVDMLHNTKVYIVINYTSLY